MSLPKSRVMCCGLLLLVLAGCSKGPPVRLAYFRNAKYAIPAGIRNIGIAEFGSMGRRGRKWGEIASDRVEALLDTYNRKYNRYQLVDRRRLRAILDERDLQMAISDTTTAARAGKLADCDAMIYGNVKVDSRDERRKKQVYDSRLRRMKDVWFVHRYCMAAVNFTMDNINTGKTLASVSLTREYDSDRDRQSGGMNLGAMFGGTPDAPPPTDQIISGLIDQCVKEFISRISPHEVVFVEHLQKGDSDLVETGNKLAEAGDYGEALEYYLNAIQQVPTDHEAMFNAGVMYEKAGKLDKAGEYYDRAFRIKDEEIYIRARRRVRQERGGPR